MVDRVVYLAAARDDLRAIYGWVADAAGSDAALAYVGRIRAWCERLADFPRRGTPREDLSPGLRTILFERKAIIAHSIDDDEVRIVRILHRGRELGAAFEP